MTTIGDKEANQKNPRPPSPETRTLAERALPDIMKHRKPIGPVTYTIEKGANVWPWQSKS